MSDPLAPAACWHCGEDTVIRLPGDWQDRINHGAALPLVGCGNPWHYATAGLDTSALAAPPPEAGLREALEAFGTRLAAEGYGWEAIITREGPNGEETVAHLTTANPDPERLAASPADPPSNHRRIYPNAAFDSEDAWCACGNPWPCSPADPPSEPCCESGNFGDGHDCRKSPSDPDMEERLAGDLHGAWMDWAEAQPEQEFDAWAAARLIAQGWRRP